jgi:acetyltransferase
MLAQRRIPSAEGCRDVALDDGRGARIRPLRPTERAKYKEAVDGLSARSRYLRFASPLPRISERLLDQMMGFDDDRHIVYAALTADETTVVGVVRYIRSADDPQSAEVAIAVADDWQGHGLGWELFGQVVEHARLAGLDSLTATTLSENHVAARLARAAGFSVVRSAENYTDYEIRLNSVAGAMS